MDSSGCGSNTLQLAHDVTLDISQAKPVTRPSGPLRQAWIGRNVYLRCTSICNSDAFHNVNSRILICDLISKMFSCVTKVTLEAEQPHPWPVVPYPVVSWALILREHWLVCCFGADSLPQFINIGFDLQPLHRTGKDRKKQSIRHHYFVPLVSGSGLVREWFQDS